MDMASGKETVRLISRTIETREEPFCGMAFEMGEAPWLKTLLLWSIEDYERNASAFAEHLPSSAAQSV